ncbi:MAG TPA: uroporphyrinogen-III synthase [Burkholderiales bacterium]|nr:uroporphyrinogen-III synthase [Burkholderiales bacterium]
MGTKPLTGRGVVVTRPRELAGALAGAIEEAGGRAILFPTIAIEDAPPPEALRHLDAYDLAVFVSPTAVQKVMVQVASWPERLQAAAIGAGSRRELERRGVPGVLAPDEGADSEALLGLSALQRMQGKRVVIFRGGAGRPLLGDALATRGALVEYADCYRRVLAKSDPAPLLASWQQGGVDAVTVSSSEGLENFVTLVGAAQLTATPLFVPHARVAARARELGAREVAVAGAADAAVLERLVAYFHERA